MQAFCIKEGEAPESVAPFVTTVHRPIFGFPGDKVLLIHLHDAESGDHQDVPGCIFTNSPNPIIQESVCGGVGGKPMVFVVGGAAIIRPYPQTSVPCAKQLDTPSSQARA